MLGKGCSNAMSVPGETLPSIVEEANVIFVLCILQKNTAFLTALLTPLSLSHIYLHIQGREHAYLFRKSRRKIVRKTEKKRYLGVTQQISLDQHTVPLLHYSLSSPYFWPPIVQKGQTDADTHTNSHNNTHIVEMKSVSVNREME